MKFRSAADQPEGAAPFQKHMEGCDGCKQWHRENEEMMAMVGSIPQFDVQEVLTQRIMASVQAQPAKRFSTSMLTPVAVVAAAAACTVTPVDSLEGLLSTAVGLVGLYVVYLVVKSAPADEMAV